MAAHGVDHCKVDVNLLLEHQRMHSERQSWSLLLVNPPKLYIQQQKWVRQSRYRILESVRIGNAYPSLRLP